MDHPYFFSTLVLYLLIFATTIAFARIGIVKKRSFLARHRNAEVYSFPNWHPWVCFGHLPVFAIFFLYAVSKISPSELVDIVLLNLMFLFFNLAALWSLSSCLCIEGLTVFKFTLFGSIESIDLRSFKQYEIKEMKTLGGTSFVGETETIRVWWQYENSDTAIASIKSRMPRHRLN